MSSRKVMVHDDAKQQQEIGRIDNEQGPRLQREIPPEQLAIGVINNEKCD